MTRCQICLGPYIDPRILPKCGHSFCAICLQGLHRASNAHVHTGPDNRSILRCPICREESSVQMDNLPKNFALQETIRSRQDDLAANGQVECDNCKGSSKEQQSWWCHQEQVQVCSYCLVTEHRGHEQISLPDLILRLGEIQQCSRLSLERIKLDKENVHSWSKAEKIRIDRHTAFMDLIIDLLRGGESIHRKAALKLVEKGMETATALERYNSLTGDYQTKVRKMQVNAMRSQDRSVRERLFNDMLKVLHETGDLFQDLQRPILTQIFIHLKPEIGAFLRSIRPFVPFQPPHGTEQYFTVGEKYILVSQTFTSVKIFTAERPSGSPIVARTYHFNPLFGSTAASTHQQDAADENENEPSQPLDTNNSGDADNNQIANASTTTTTAANERGLIVPATATTTTTMTARNTSFSSQNRNTQRLITNSSHQSTNRITATATRQQHDQERIVPLQQAPPPAANEGHHPNALSQVVQNLLEHQTATNGRIQGPVIASAAPSGSDLNRSIQLPPRPILTPVRRLTHHHHHHHSPYTGSFLSTQPPPQLSSSTTDVGPTYLTNTIDTNPLYPMINPLSTNHHHQTQPSSSTATSINQSTFQTPTNSQSSVFLPPLPTTTATTTSYQHQQQQQQMHQHQAYQQQQQQQTQSGITTTNSDQQSNTSTSYFQVYLHPPPSYSVVNSAAAIVDQEMTGTESPTPTMVVQHRLPHSLPVEERDEEDDGDDEQQQMEDEQQETYQQQFGENDNHGDDHERSQSEYQAIYPQIVSDNNERQNDDDDGDDGDDEDDDGDGEEDEDEQQQQDGLTTRITTAAAHQQEQMIVDILNAAVYQQQQLQDHGYHQQESTRDSVRNIPGDDSSSSASVSSASLVDVDHELTVHEQVLRLAGYAMRSPPMLSSGRSEGSAPSSSEERAGDSDENRQANDHQAAQSSSTPSSTTTTTADFINNYFFYQRENGRGPIIQISRRRPHTIQVYQTQQ